jgi:hypothetical protein
MRFHVMVKKTVGKNCAGVSSNGSGRFPSPSLPPSLPRHFAAVFVQFSHRLAHLCLKLNPRSYLALLEKESESGPVAPVRLPECLLFFLLLAVRTFLLLYRIPITVLSSESKSVQRMKAHQAGKCRWDGTPRWLSASAYGGHRSLLFRILFWLLLHSCPRRCCHVEVKRSSLSSSSSSTTTPCSSLAAVNRGT